MGRRKRDFFSLETLANPTTGYGYGTSHTHAKAWSLPGGANPSPMQDLSFERRKTKWRRCLRLYTTGQLAVQLTDTIANYLRTSHLYIFKKAKVEAVITH